MAPITWKHLSSRTGDLPAPPGSQQQTTCIVLDADRDGRSEFIVACRGKAPALAWYRPMRSGWSVYTIEAESMPIEAGGTFFDVDGDGYPDILAGNDYQGNHVYWWKNPGPHYAPESPWKRHEIKNSGGTMHHDLIVGDFDGDGKPELVFWNQYAKEAAGGGKTGALYHCPIPADPTVSPWQYKPIWFGAGEGVASGDIDGDGRPELLAGGKWFKHTGNGQFAAYTIDPAQTHPRIGVGDLNGDGRLEVVLVNGDSVGRLKWYECKGDPKRAENWAGHDLVGADVIHGHSLAIADFDGDGHLDILCCEMAKWTEAKPVPDHPDAHIWLFYGNGKGDFTKTVIATGMGVHEAKIGDMDGDGRLDIVAKPYCWDTPRVDLWLNKP